MVTQYDEKGKFFTEVVSKEQVRAMIQTSCNMIHGCLHVRPNTRLKDEINAIRENFVAVTDAVVFNQQNVELYRSNFLLLNIDQIVWVIPEEEVHS